MDVGTGYHLPLPLLPSVYRPAPQAPEDGRKEASQTFRPLLGMLIEQIHTEEADRHLMLKGCLDPLAGGNVGLLTAFPDELVRGKKRCSTGHLRVAKVRD